MTHQTRHVLYAPPDLRTEITARWPTEGLARAHAIQLVARRDVSGVALLANGVEVPIWPRLGMLQKEETK